MATISRAEMQSAIAAGGVVLHGGRIYNDPKDLPTEAELAGEDPAKLAAAREALEARMKMIQEEIALIDAGGHASAQKPALAVGAPAPPAVAPPHPMAGPVAHPVAAPVTAAPVTAGPPTIPPHPVTTPPPPAKVEPKVEGKK